MNYEHPDKWERYYAHGCVSCHSGTEAHVAWASVQELVHADVGALAPHAGARCRNVDSVPPRLVAHRRRRAHFFFTVLPSVRQGCKRPDI